MHIRIYTYILQIYLLEIYAYIMYTGEVLLPSELTLIRAAGVVYDFQNFEEVYLCNSLSSELHNSCIPKKPLGSISC
jgi:hypothetical protein